MTDSPCNPAEERAAPDAVSGVSRSELEALRRGKDQLLDELEMAYQQMEKLLATTDRETRVAYDELRSINASLRREINERQLVEERLKVSLQDKEVLLKEIHHRVKNNLQVISSLLDLQASHIKDEQARLSINDSRARVLSMALIHEKLYQTEDLAKVDFGEYLRTLATQVFDSYKAGEQTIALHIHADPIYLNMDKAIPCGLILNELVANSLKYAFPSGQSGQIHIELRARGDDEVVLSVGDNGVGLPPEVDFRKTDSLGMKLIGVLTTQLRGSIELRQGPGTTFEIAFPSAAA